MEAWWRDRQLRDRAIPAEWHRVEAIAPCRRKKVQVTAGYDADLVRWFRGLGQGYQGRMNAVLRAYMLAVIAKEIEGKGDRTSSGKPI